MYLSLAVLLCVSCTIYMVNGQAASNKAFCKSSTSADTCLMHLLLIGDPKYVFPENMDSMNKQCSGVKSYEKCIKDYASKCLPSFPKQVTSVMAYGVAKTNKGYCSNKRRKEAFISIGKCGNKVKSKVDVCMRQYIDNLQGSENHPDVKERIPLACCNYYRLKGCIMNHVETQGQPLCSESVATEIENIVDGYANEVLNLLCGDYTEESDKCVKLLPKTPKKLPAQKPPKSLLLPLINIIASVPQ
ncbi:unnamed protein product [Oppiella nova]|uniref:Uncharacterized protein n=1 Tax=Oppiella nova TaxID=334625 RepID=A0A7R9MM58_9ACAR|nr:unnamed protein product [Oppiella nova]CAG2179059.1 unnamed protein product [Oppiella nova]